MPSVLLTGATGFIGGRLARQLIAAGYRVRALVRDPSQAKDLAEAGIELTQGDVTDGAEALTRALEGVNGVLHLAAIYAFGVPPERMAQVNVEGTKNLLDAAERAGIERILYCGSDTSLGDTAGKLCDETKTHDGAGFRSAYEETKRGAHLLVCQRMKAGAPIINAIVSTVYGPGDKSAIGELMRFHVAGRLSIILDRDAGYTFAHVDDVATALRLGYEKGQPGECYLVSGTPASFGELFDKMSSLTGIPAPAELPRWARGVLPLLAALGPLIGKSRAAMRELFAMGRDVTRFFSGERARRRLGWEPRSLETGLAQTLAWFQEQERAAAERGLLGFTRVLLVGLTLFDIALGVQAALYPHAYIESMHPHFWARHPSGPVYWLIRTGALWLFFAAAQGYAALDPRRRALAVFLVGMLRLMDVPADLVYLIAADDLGQFGRFGLLFSPMFNLCSGLYLVSRSHRAIRAGLASTRTLS